MGSVANTTTAISPTPTAFSVAVVGGGIGGLSLAIGLLKHSHIDVQIYEAAPSFGEIGAGIAISPNAQRALELIGPHAKEAFSKLATPNLWVSHANNYTENRVAYGEHEGEIIAAQKNQTGMQCLHRARFLDELVKLIPAQRAHFGKRLTKIEHKTEDEGCVLYFKDGTTAIADAIIGADGIHSAVRLYLLGETHPASKPVFTGTATYRGIVSMDRAIEKLGAELAQNSIMLCGPGAAILSYPIEHGAELNIVLMDFEVGEKWEHEKWIVPAKFEDLARLIDGWGRSAQNMIELLDSPDLAVWALWDHPPAPFYNKGPVAMMGDAAHATTPFQGQGAAHAIEDALVLEVLLGSTESASQLANAFAAYDQVRRPRTQRMVTTSRESGELLGMKAPGVGSDLRKMREKLETRMHWLWNRDLVAQNAAAIKLLKESL